MRFLMLVLAVMGVILLAFGHTLAGLLLMAPFGVHVLLWAAIGLLTALIEALDATDRRKRRRARR